MTNHQYDPLPQEFLDNVRRLLEETVLEQDSLITFIEGWKQGEQRFTTGITEDMPSILPALRVLITQIGLDRIIITADAYAAESEINPRTKQPWRRGEMAQGVRDNDVLIRSAVRDYITISDMRPDEDHFFQYPYSFDPVGNKVIWHEDSFHTSVHVRDGVNREHDGEVQRWVHDGFSNHGDPQGEEFTSLFSELFKIGIDDPEIHRELAAFVLFLIDGPDGHSRPLRIPLTTERNRQINELLSSFGDHLSIISS